MSKLLKAMIELDWESRIQEEIAMSGFTCPYCLDVSSKQQGHDGCIKEMKEEFNPEYKNICYELETL